MSVCDRTPEKDCRLCSRLAEFRDKNRQSFPSYFNNPVPCFGPADASIAIVGLAPGLHGANQTGRPFTGDYAGDLLYSTLIKFGLAKGIYAERADDGLQLVNCRIINAVRCVPPENKPTGDEINQCQTFLKAELQALRPGLHVIIALGTIAHNSTLKALGVRPAACKFGHGHRHNVNGLTVLDSYHCSRYNTNTGRLTETMFHDVFQQATKIISS